MVHLAFHALHTARRLRGTGWDPFGYARVRRAERALIDEYRHVVGLFMTRLGTDPVQDRIDVANLPDRVRGYEDVKLDSITAYRAELTARTAALNASPERI